MSKRAGNNVCLFCQLRRQPSALNRQAPFMTRPLTGQASTSAPEQSTQLGFNKQDPFTNNDVQQQLKLFGVTDTFRRRILSILSRNKGPSFAVLVQSKLSAIARSSDQSNGARIQDDSLKGSSLSVSTSTLIDLICFQLRSASSIEDIVQVLTHHLKAPPSAESRAKAQRLATSSELTQTIRLQLSGLSIGRQLSVLGLLTARFEAYGQQLARPLLIHALNISAAEHSLPAFYQFFKALLTSTNYSALDQSELANILISLNFGLARIPRQINSKPIPAVIQLLYGSSNRSPNTHRLEQVLAPNDLTSLGPWLAILVFCKAHDEIWREWQLAETGQRWICSHANDTDKINMELERASLFIAAFLRLGRSEQAWEVYQASADAIAAAQRLPHPATDDLDTYGIHHSVWNGLVYHWSSKPSLSQPLQDALNQSLLNRLAFLCSQVETELGATWQPPTDTNEGSHTIPWADPLQEEPTDQPGTVLPAFLLRAVAPGTSQAWSPTLKLLETQLALFTGVNDVSGSDRGSMPLTPSRGFNEPDSLELAVVKPWGFKSMAELLRAFRKRTSGSTQGPN